jgi:20S proteasome alpha/beta subunit
VFKVDPAGHYLPYKAVSTGKYEPEAMNYLEKKVDELGGMDEESTIEMVRAFLCLAVVDCVCNVMWKLIFVNDMLLLYFVLISFPFLSLFSASH